MQTLQTSRSPAEHTDYASHLAYGLLPLLTGAYLLQLLSPLRLNTDAVILLSIADSIATGHGYPVTHYPPGYPLMIALLTWSTLQSPATIVGLNLCFLTVGLACTYLLISNAASAPRWLALYVCCGTLLSYLYVKHSPLPLSDIPFFGLGMASLLTLFVTSNSTGRRCAYLSLLSIVLVIASVAVRTIGISLVPSLLLVLISKELPSYILHQHKWPAIMLSIGATVIIVAVPLVLFREPSIVYLHESLGKYASADLIQSIQWILLQRLLELGELILNIPRSWLPEALHWLNLVAGVCAIVAISYTVWKYRTAMPVTNLFLVVYLVIIFVWPYSDARFWIPVVPLVALYVSLALDGWWPGRWSKLPLATWAIWIVITGTVAITITTRTSLAGSDFPELYGDGSLRATYRVAFGIAHDGDMDDTSAETLHLLQQFDPRARRSTNEWP